MSNINGTRYTAFYRCPDEINNLKIRVKIKEVSDVVLSEAETFQDWETATIGWQDKLFSRFEKEFYGNEKNCLTDLEKKYHKAVSKSIETNRLLFSYTSEDDYAYEEETVTSNNVSYLQKEMEKMRIFKDSSESSDEEVEEPSSKLIYNDNDYKNSLMYSMRHPVISNKYEQMFIMADVGEYVDDTWIKYEVVVCCIRYYKKRRLMTLYPDFSPNSPYCTRIPADTLRCVYFTIENASEQMPEDMVFAETELLKKIIQQQNDIKRQAIGAFELPPKNTLSVHLFFEITHGKYFEYDICVQYFIELPVNWTCRTPETLKGTTQVSRTNLKNGGAFFGHVFDIVLDYNLQNFQSDNAIPKPPFFYFEVVSKDSWDRYRCEGLGYRALPVGTPGIHHYDIKCFRVCSSTFYGSLRRFFIGDCRNYNDITWIGIPKDHQGPVLNKFGVDTFGTGELSMRVYVLHQSQAFLSEYSDGNGMKSREKFVFDKLNASSLVKSVEQVLQAFRRARKNMLEAKKDL